MDNERTINLIALGDNFVGKTSIINRIKYRTFQETHPTISTDFYFTKKKHEKKNIMINLAFCDTPGQEGFEMITSKEYFNNSHIVLLVFCDIETLNTLKYRWLNYYKEYVNIENSSFILIGNKSDIFGDNRDEILKQGEKFSEEIDAIFITCSAKSEDNMDNLERFIIKEAKRFIDEEERKKEYYFFNKEKKDKKESLKNDNYEHKKIVNYDDENKVSIWQNSKLNKYISF